MNKLNTQLQAALAMAYANAPAVKERFDNAGISPASIQSIADLHQIPVLAKDDLIAQQQANPPFGGLLGVPLSQVRHIYFSPGPLYEPDAGDETGLNDMAQYCLRQSGFAPGDVVLNTLSYHLVPAGSLLDAALVGIGCTVIPGGVGNSDLQLKMMADLNVTAYVGTPSFLMSLIQKAEGMGLEFKRHFKLKKAFVTAEPLSPTLRQTLSSRYGISLGNGYATAELGFLALSLGEGMAMQLLPAPIVQIVDPDTGQTVGAGEVGEVVVTNFSRVYPLIRLGTGDMAVNVDPNPGASQQQERAIILVGRSGEAVKVRGMFVHPNQLRFAAGQIAGISKIQGIVSRHQNRDHFSVRVMLAPDLSLEQLAEPLKQAIRATCRVGVDEVVVAGIPADAPGMVDERSWD